MTLVDIETEMLKLTPKERGQLAARLLASLEQSSADEVEQSWLEEAERRDAAMDADGVRGRPAAEALAAARARVR